MASRPLGSAVRQFRRLDDGSVTDRELLELFAAGERNASFGRLVERHGAMVYGVCKRVLRNADDADDAFQATFLVLAKQARSRGWHDSIANYLYGVAFRTAMRARGRNTRRKFHEENAPPRPDSLPDDRVSIQELRSAVDEELVRLPEKFRVPVLLCCLHDRTIDEAAATLGLPATTVKGRVQQGRDLLRQRLTRRGITLGAGVLATLVGGGKASAVSPDLLAKTLKLAEIAPATGSIAALAKQELAMLFWKKVRAVASVLGLAAVVAGGGFLTIPVSTSTAAPVRPDPPAIENRGKPSDPVEKDGLEVVARPTKAVFRTGEQIEIAVTYRNTTKMPLIVTVADPSAPTDWNIWRAGEKSPQWKAVQLETPLDIKSQQADQLRRLALTQTIDPGQTTTETHKVPTVFDWVGEQSAKPMPVRSLPEGSYEASATLVCPKSEIVPLRRGDKQANPVWSGEIKLNPVRFRVSDDIKDLPASEPATKNGLSVTVRPTKFAFAADEQPQFEVIFRNTSKKPFIVTDVDLATDTWQIFEANGTGPWQSGPFAYSARAPGGVYRLDPDSRVYRVSHVEKKYVRGPFQWKGEQAKPVRPVEFLRPGKYKAVVKLSFGSSSAKKEIPEWTGELDSQPVEFTIAEKEVPAPAPLVISEEMTGKKISVKVGQTIQFRLKSEKKSQGWTMGGGAGNSLRRLGTLAVFHPASRVDDPSVGTYCFDFQAVSEGVSELEASLIHPAGPTFENVKQAEKVRSFQVTIEVKK